MLTEGGRDLFIVLAHLTQSFEQGIPLVRVFAQLFEPPPLGAFNRAGGMPRVPDDKRYEAGKGKIGQGHNRPEYESFIPVKPGIGPPESRSRFL